MEMYEKALGIKRKALGEDHSDVGDTYGNMAIVMHEKLQGEPDRCVELRALWDGDANGGGGASELRRRGGRWRRRWLW